MSATGLQHAGAAVSAALALLAWLAVVIAQLPARACCYRRAVQVAPPWKRGLHWREWHHGYLIALLPAAVWLWYHDGLAWKLGAVVLAALLLWAYVDDLRQHLVQLRDPGKRYYRSHLKRFSERTWYSWKQKLGMRP